MDTPNLQLLKQSIVSNGKKIGGQKVSTTYDGSIQYVVKLVCP